MRRQIQGTRAIVTGASSGIGRELALELARRGAKVIVNGRRAERLAELVGEMNRLGANSAFIAGDVTDASIRQDLIEAARERFNGLDLLINNAGVGALGPFADADESRLRRLMEVNFFAPAELMRLALPVLREGRQPAIINISSVLGHRAVPNKSEYCASKFALHGLSDALRAELSDARIDVLLVSPSTTESEFFDNVLEKQGGGKSYGRPMPAHTVAKKTLRALERGQHEIILSGSGKALVWLDRLFPTLTNWLIARFSR